MKRIAVWVGCLGLLMTQVGCQNRVAKLEKIVADLEARIKKLEARIAPKRPKEQDKPYPIPLYTEAGDPKKKHWSPVLGNKDATVSMVVFVDMQCPFCARSNPLAYEIIKDPVLKDRVNVVLKHFPLSFHKDAKPAAKASLSAHGQGMFWPFLDKIYANQRDLTKKNFEKWIQEVQGDDGKKGNRIQLIRDLIDNDKVYEEIIQADMKVGIQTAKVDGTPYILLGKREGDTIQGWKLPHAQRSLDGVKSLIKEKKIIDLKKPAAGAQ